MASLIALPDDILAYICGITHKLELGRLMRSCRRFAFLEIPRKIHSWASLEEILPLPNYPSFTHVQADSKAITAMRQQKRALPASTTHLLLRSFVGYLQTHTRDLQFLTHLTVASDCKFKIGPGCLPRTVTHLVWDLTYALGHGILHEGLVLLRANNYHHSTIALPSTLQNLHLARNSRIARHNLSIGLQITRGMLPNGLRVLSLGAGITIDDDAVPETVKKMIFGKGYVFPPRHRQQDTPIPFTLDTCVLLNDRLLEMYADVDPATIPACRVKFIKSNPLYCSPDLTLQQAVAIFLTAGIQGQPQHRTQSRPSYRPRARPPHRSQVRRPYPPPSPFYDNYWDSDDD